MEPKFKVGDKVLIKNLKNLSSLDYKVPFSINEAMWEYSGKKAKIIEVSANTYGLESYSDLPPHVSLDRAKYVLDIDERKWSWSLPMLSSIDERDSSILISVKKKVIHFNFNN